jgi:hypothetical protein
MATAHHHQLPPHNLLLYRLPSIDTSITAATAIATTTAITITTRIIHRHNDFFYPEHGIAAESTSAIENRRRIIGFLSAPRGVAFVVAKI